MTARFDLTEFEWDEHNASKNWRKHSVSPAECEEIFFNEPLLIARADPSKILYNEQRRLAYGSTNAGRSLFIVFVIRGNKIRVISARDMSRKERSFYHEETEKTD